MEYNVDEKHYRINVKGSKKEVKKFTRCLVEVVNKYYLSEFDSIKLSKEPMEINPTAYERFYLSDTSLLYLPNVHSEEAKKFHFNILMIHYQKAKDNFERSQ
jgi:hypothetical protein